MKQGLTEIVFILDRSGSMCGLEKDTIGGFNSTIEKQKAIPGEAYVSTILFDDKQEVLHDRVNIKTIEPLTEKDYYARGGTALMDALGSAIHHIGNVHKYARDEDRPEHTIFVITTDGYENASHHYTAEKIRQMITRQKEKYGWEFVFLGANIDAVETAKHYGISENRAANFVNDKEGICMAYKACDMIVEGIRDFSKLDSIESSWKDEIEKDVKKRRK